MQVYRWEQEREYSLRSEMGRRREEASSWHCGEWQMDGLLIWRCQQPVKRSVYIHVSSWVAEDIPLAYLRAHFGVRGYSMIERRFDTSLYVRSDTHFSAHRWHCGQSFIMSRSILLKKTIQWTYYFLKLFTISSLINEFLQVICRKLRFTAKLESYRLSVWTCNRGIWVHYWEFDAVW